MMLVLEQIMAKKVNMPPRYRRHPLEPLQGFGIAGSQVARYANFLIPPVGAIDRELIVSEKHNTDRIVATLGLKEMTQSSS